MITNRLALACYYMFVVSNNMNFDSINCLTRLSSWAGLKNLEIMSTLRNKVQLIGNLGNDPEIVNLDGGRKLAKFSVATNETYKNQKGEKITDTQWHNVVAWGKTAEIIETYVTKGKEVAIEGKLTSRSYDDKEGNKKYITEVVCNELVMLGSK